MSSETLSTKRFIRESLPLLSSFLYSEQVTLKPTEVEVGKDSLIKEHERFANLIRMRHAIACGLRLKPILEAIERGISTVSEMVRSESKGTINGRLDIQLYLNRRNTNLSWPRTFPVLVAKDSMNTPENQLVVEALRQVANRLKKPSLIESSAERTHSLNLLRWSRERLKSDPWSQTTLNRSTERLKLETAHRLRKRQTGNEPAYLRFLNWLSQWQFDAACIDSEEIEDFISLLLAFPLGDFFKDRVYEIWCLHQAIEACLRCGVEIVAGPHPLNQRKSGPICEMQYNNYRFSIWFQKSLPNTVAKWKYLHSRQMLGGIPDITMLSDNGKRLIIDAKRRQVVTKTRSEETYKMLGYIENFRNLFEADRFYGVLCFLSYENLFTEVITDRGDCLFLVGAHPEDVSTCTLGSRMDTIVAQWLSLVAN